MTKKVFTLVQPILKGLTSTVGLQFSNDFWTAYSLNSNQLAVTFNDTLDDSTPLWVASTVAGNVVRDNTNKTVVVTIPKEQTALWDFDYINFDLIRYNGSIIYGIPGVWVWPIEKRVGLNVPS